MRAYFYHTQNLQQVVPQWENGDFPGHLLYGATCLSQYGIEVVWHKSLSSTSRFRQIIHVTKEVLLNYCHFDIIYATHYQGLDFIIMLRALHLFSKPIVIWHHQPITKSPFLWRELLAKVFYRGIDDMFFFSQKLINDSLQSSKAISERIHLGHWGADLFFYDRILQQDVLRKNFISTGKEMRDMSTLVNAFNNTGYSVDIYLAKHVGDINYGSLFDHLKLKDNVQVHFVSGLNIYQIGLEVHRHAVVVICCLETNYTVGLTTLVEALALGIPVICSRNPQFPIDVQEEGCGISVNYYDIEGWEKAINYIVQHPEDAAEMGRRGRLLAERRFNLETCGAEVAAILNKYKS